MLNLYQHRVLIWMSENADDHPFSLVHCDVLMSKLLVPSSNWTAEIYKSSEPQITMDTVMTLPMGPPCISRTEFLHQLVADVRKTDGLDDVTTHTYTKKTLDGRRYNEYETHVFGHLFRDPNIHKINSDSKEAGVLYLEEKLDYTGETREKPTNDIGYIS